MPRQSEIRRLFNRARLLAHMLSIRALRRPPFPLYVNLVINSRCNLRCAYCFGHYPLRGHADLAFPEFCRLVTALRQRGTVFILIQGGEPLLHPQLGDMLAFLHDQGIISAIVSNGQCPERIAQLPELELMDNICFSLDGNAAGNDLVRGGGSFAKVMRSIAEVQRHYTLPVRLNTTVHRHVLDDVPFMAELVRAHHLEWGVAFLFHGNEQLAGTPLAPAAEERRAYLQRILAYKRRGYPIFTTTRILQYCHDWPDAAGGIAISRARARALHLRNYVECQYGSYEVVIDEDGCVYPCQAMQGIFPARNIHTDGLAAALAHLDGKPCHTCCIPPLINTSAMINWDAGVIIETVGDALRNRYHALRTRHD